MKFATYVMTYDQGKWMLRNLENAYPHVDQIYVMHSELPWGYKPEAREKYTNTFDLNIIKDSPYMDKITIIEGDWLGDAEQRNFCRKRAMADGYDFLMVHDADEFYFHNDFDKIRRFVQDNPQYDGYSINLHAFWKNFGHILVNHDDTLVGGCNQTIIKLREGVQYDYIRDTWSENRVVIPDVMQYHGSYVLTDEEVWKKVNMTSHSNDFDGIKWYNEVWLPWTEESTNLHPIWPWAWKRAEKFTGELPEAIEDFDFYN